MREKLQFAFRFAQSGYYCGYTHKWKIILGKYTNNWAHDCLTSKCPTFYWFSQYVSGRLRFVVVVWVCSQSVLAGKFIPTAWRTLGTQINFLSANSIFMFHAVVSSKGIYIYRGWCYIRPLPCLVSLYKKRLDFQGRCMYSVQIIAHIYPIFFIFIFFYHLIIKQIKYLHCVWVTGYRWT